MRDVPDLFRDGIEDWLRGITSGDMTPEGDAAGSLLAEIAIRHRQWLEAQFKK